MIEYLKGTLADLTPALAVIECHGVGYGVNISLNTFSAIQGKQEVKLWITESIREDAYQLWGFSTRTERELFLLLTSVSGIGAGTSRVILSSMTVPELAAVISEGNDKMLKTVKGIGPKAAQRIIVDLRDKIGSLGIEAASPTAPASPVVNKEVMDEAVAALTMLGFSPAPAHKAVQKILTDEPEAPVERVIKLALKML
ncbi:MAG: Holliday junction branch migration protein RuvA [Bacteroidaceae bacterium]|jgi:Holliday junction DNA helicase RuvA|nr:Holliday junction branch migration protein RuvA [Bacteroidaceae bacterium]MBQ2293135.1 Holliday junction branch migration protein RuvA [Bacteroidaceae bacterium]MBQ5680089.1 Holliday junction branch migration protein RuvA [Bacteroidaceae bacterium]MBQ5713300.1 Holliday junction branch migration protein RuvA [Bacteroidaceae bacterium]MBR0544490.1 Holliday junction branch migration protein RuvA [Bacteroidaceae bacterium]